MENFKYIVFHKPYGVLCQFTGEPGDKTLAGFNFPPGVYAAGRLDKDSEGLLILTDDGVFNQRITNPKSNKKKTYHIQVEKIPSENDLIPMREGLKIKGYQTLPCEVRLISQPDYKERIPPIRQRKGIPTAWLEVKLTEGKNRQVRRMSAKIGYPTLRLIRSGIGKLQLQDLAVGQWKLISKEDIL
jgi:23S rRNA pseudouridine2457 synthase